MLKGLSNTWLLITALVILVTGTLSTLFLIRDYNIQSDIFGEPIKEQTSYKIDDFNFQVNNLIFSETGNENEYIATATTLPITNFDKTKNYTLVVNETLCNRTNGSYEFVQATFNNNFKDIKNNIIFEGQMLISIVPYKDYTKLTFIVNGENSTNYWNQYIVNYGLTITIVEQGYIAKIEADNLSTKYVYYYDIEGNLIEDYTEQISFNNFPYITLKNCVTVDGTQYPLWRSSNNELISQDNLIYECTEYKDLHFYLFDYTYVMVDMKISQNLMYEFNAKYNEWREFYGDNYQGFYTTYNFAKFYFTLNFNNSETQSASVWPMQGYVTKYAIPDDLFIQGATVVTDLDNIEFLTDSTYLNQTCYENITYTLEIKSTELAGVSFPLIEIKLFNNDEDINTLQWGAQSGYIFEEWDN